MPARAFARGRWRDAEARLDAAAGALRQEAHEVARPGRMNQDKRQHEQDRKEEAREQQQEQVSSASLRLLELSPGTAV